MSNDKQKASAEMQKLITEAEHKLREIRDRGKPLGLLEGAELGTWAVISLVEILPLIRSLEADLISMEKDRNEKIARLFAVEAENEAMKKGYDIVNQRESAYQNLVNKVAVLRAENETLKREHGEMRKALEVLSRLGNGEHLGNSDGNCIAQKALSSIPPRP